MKIVHVQSLVVGDVYAYEIKSRKRKAYIVTEIPDGKNHLMATTAESITSMRKNIKEGQMVYWLRNINETNDKQRTHKRNKAT